MVSDFNMDGAIQEKEQILAIINNYILRLEKMKENIDKEIENKYFSLSCLGDDMEYMSIHLFKKYHKEEYEESLAD